MINLHIGSRNKFNEGSENCIYYESYKLLKKEMEDERSPMLMTEY
jgi:hypothetical protein